MPIFVWIAIAIAIVLIGAGAATGFLAHPFVAALNGPLGYILTIAIVGVIALFVFKKPKT
jgi:hypothetical protein